MKSGGYFHPECNRLLTVREAARLQSFTDGFVFLGNMREQYVQIGNAVPPLLSYAIAKKIADAIKKNYLGEKPVLVGWGNVVQKMLHANLEND